MQLDKERVGRSNLLRVERIVVVSFGSSGGLSPRETQRLHDRYHRRAIFVGHEQVHVRHAALIVSNVRTVEKKRRAFERNNVQAASLRLPVYAVSRYH